MCCSDKCLMSYFIFVVYVWCITSFAKNVLNWFIHLFIKSFILFVFLNPCPISLYPTGNYFNAFISLFLFVCVLEISVLLFCVCTVYLYIEYMVPEPSLYTYFVFLEQHCFQLISMLLYLLLSLCFEILCNSLVDCISDI